MPRFPRILSAFASALAVLALAANASIAQNLLTNPSFESLPGNLHVTSGTQILNGWRYFSAGGASFTLDATSDSYEGVRAVVMTRTTTTGDAGLDRDDPTLRVPVIGGHTYVASLWAKAVGSASVILTVSPYDSAGDWLGVQTNQTYTLTTSYQQYSLAYTTPANTASLNFAIRVNGVGTVIADYCCLTETAPRVTYPVDETVDRLKPAIGFTGLAHTAWQIVITKAGNTVWDSGEVSSTAWSGNCANTLQPSTAHQVKVRVKNSGSWGDYCSPVSFTTPAGPIVYFTSPKEADRVIGPDKLLTWQAESYGSVSSQSLVIDGAAPIQIPAANRTYQLSGLSDGAHSVALTVNSADGSAQTSSRFYVYSAPATSGTIYYYDCSYVLGYDQSSNPAYDIPMAVSALQGIVNRSGTRLFVRMSSYDDRWWNVLRGSGGWLQGKTVVTLTSLASLFNTFKADCAGVVIWDNNVKATSNLATTIAGADNLIPARYNTTVGSVYQTLVLSASGPRLTVQLDLRNRFTGSGTIWQTTIPSTGSKKCDAYLWAIDKYIETGKSDPSLLLYAIDGYWQTFPNKGALSNYLPIRDYVVRNKGFAFDLSVWGDETPIDDPTQTLGLDLQTMRSILAACAARAPGMIEEIGFCPFPMKYSNVSGAGGILHEPVSCEWEQIKWASLYNAYVDADALAQNADMSNASLYCQYPLPDRLIQNRKYSQLDLRKLGYLDKNGVVSPLNYLNVYIGDYDSSSWTTKIASDNWWDSGRGSVPMSWAFNPNLIKRTAPIYEYYNRTATANDFFIAGDSGSGYVNCSRLIGTRESGLPSAEDIWVAHNLKFFRQTNVKISGFILNGTAGPVETPEEEMYARFSVDGVFQRDYPDHVTGTMPSLLQLHDLDMDDTATSSIEKIFPDGQRWATQFLNYRSVIRTPTWIRSLYDGVVTKDPLMAWTILDSDTYGALASCNLGHPPDCRATYTFDTVASTVYAGVFLTTVIGVRNDGWTAWASTGPDRVTLVLKWMNGSQTVTSVTAPLPRDVPSADAVTIDVTTITPPTPGNYTLHYELARRGVTFTDLGDYAWEKTITAIPTGHFPGVSAFSAAPSDRQVSLSWTNPSNPNLAGVMIRSKTTSYPTSVSDGSVVYNGPGASCLHTGLTNGVVYYYTAFAYDHSSNYSDPVVGSAMPQLFLDWINESFDAYSSGGLGHQGAWLTRDLLSAQVQSSQTLSAGDKAVLLDPMAEGGSVGNFISVSEKSSGYCYFSFDVMQDLSGAFGSEAAYISVLGSNGDEIARVHIQQGRLLVEYDSPTQITMTPAAQNLVWYNIRIGLNIDTRRIDLWLDGQQKGNGLAWKGDATGVSTIVICSDRNTAMSPQKVYIDNLRLEPKPPTVATVRDDGVYSPSLSKLHFSFDPVVGANGYQYCISTTSSGTQIRGWTSIGTATDFTATGLTLFENVNYYIGVECTNLYGTGGDRKNNNGIKVAAGLASIPAAKEHGDAATVYSLRNKVVSASFPGYFYVQEPDRRSGIKVVSSAVVAPGDEVDAAGFLAGSASERYLDCTGNGVIRTTPGPGAPGPLFLNNPSVGGGRLNSNTLGVTGGVGVNNIGLLTRIWGKFTYVDASTFTVGDGSGVIVKCTSSGVALDPNWEFVQVTGVSSCEVIGPELHRLIRVRGQEDIVPVAGP